LSLSFKSLNSTLVPVAGNVNANVPLWVALVSSNGLFSSLVKSTVYSVPS
jgi:hypothetical protein